VKIGAIIKLIKLIEADGWEHVATRGSHRQYRHPGKAREGDRAGQALRRVASQDPSEHPQTGRIETMTDAERYLILIEGGPPSNYSDGLSI